MGQTSIEWTQQVWNPGTGCTKVSPGCKHCYAEKLALRLQRMGNPRYRNGFAVTLHPDKLDEPLGWRKPERVFVNSMSDLLHPDVPDDFVLRCLDTMRRAAWHEFQVLTKRPERWGSITEQAVARFGAWPANVLPGASIENRAALRRLEHLGRAGDADTVRMVSVEPLIESIGPAEVLAGRLRGGGIGWVITGGESGWLAREANEEWFREVRDACALASIPYFHKQHGGRGTTHEAKRGGTLATLDGRLHHEMPIVRTGPAQGRQAQLPL